MKTLLCLLLISASCIFAQAQSCRPAELNYIVRDEKGKMMTEADTQKVFAQMPKPAQGVHTLDVAADGTLVGYSARPAASKIAAIYYVDAKTCQLKIDEFTLKHAGRTMRLIFALDLERRSYTFDSVPFQTGTYRLDQTNLTDTDNNSIIPATRWKKVTK